MRGFKPLYENDELRLVVPGWICVWMNLFWGVRTEFYFPQERGFGDGDLLICFVRALKDVPLSFLQTGFMILFFESMYLISPWMEQSNLSNIS